MWMQCSKKMYDVGRGEAWTKERCGRRMERCGGKSEVVARRDRLKSEWRY